MGHRLSKIYTRTGDAGTTGLADGTRVDKDSARIEAMGAVDELNSQVAAVLVHPVPDAVRACLVDVQHGLFDVGGELAIPGATSVADADVEAIEHALDDLNRDLPPLKEFILPGGGPAAVAAHVARAVCRRAERRLLALSRLEAVNPASLRFLNRLSDYLFVLARSLAIGEHGEVYWRPRASRHGG
ncbi:MAG: cob(I)yrinic acid a,c-diamide adenosyltransferase [Ectothiorhodospiraceae bacterium]|nr:cob(I)yrinic acid a,c-diamide adenosyltransferase [Ectothiorhodospiraceae bacterium]